jgi:hypothetical protein
LVVLAQQDMVVIFESASQKGDIVDLNPANHVSQRERNSAAGMIGEDESPKNLGWVIQIQVCNQGWQTDMAKSLKVKEAVLC